jgi:hypothetical protein
MKKNFRLTSGVAACAAVLHCLVAPHASAASLTSGNSSVNIDPVTQLGMNSWLVDGQEQLYQQWFWYRIGNTAEQPINLIGAPVVAATGTQLSSTYTAPGFSISIVYDLLGGAWGSGQSTVNESIAIHNFSGSDLDFHFFQYSDYQLGGVNLDTVQLSSLFNEALVTSGAFSLGEVASTPAANRGEVAFANQTLLKLNDGAASTLDNTVGPVGPGDVTFAFEWDFTLAASGQGSSMIISKVKHLQVEVIPEPTAMTLGLLGVGLLAGRRFFRK